MSNHFNELLLQTLKEVDIRLERLEGRVDHVINEKADKIDVSDVKTELQAVTEKLDPKADKTGVKDVTAELKASINGLCDEFRSQGQCLDRIETRIRTLQWTMTVGFAALGIILAFMKEAL